MMGSEKLALESAPHTRKIRLQEKSRLRVGAIAIEWGAAPSGIVRLRFFRREREVYIPGRPSSEIPPCNPPF